MRRQAQVLVIAGAAVIAGGTLWAIASSDMLGRFGLGSTQPTIASRERPAPDQPPRSAATEPPAKVTGTAPSAVRPGAALAIEIARIDAGSTSVIAGRSPPNHRVAIVANGREIASTIASEEGQWSVIVSEGIAAGPLELSVTSMPRDGGAKVTSAPRHLVVPAPRVAEAPAAKAPAAPATASAPAPGRSPTAKIASVPQPPQAVAAKPPAPVPAAPPVARANPGADKQALEQFAALVERARADAAAAGKRDASPGGAGATSASVAPSAAATGRPSGSSAPAPAIAPTTGQDAAAPARSASATAASPTMRVGAPDAAPDPAQVPIPVPITFVTDESEMTPDGARAAALLAEYLRLKRPEAISLSGHADSRGPDGYNMDLSRRRLEAIERYLRAAGYKGDLSLVPRGKREPYLGIDRTRLSLHDVYQADRRVELRMTQ